jgi:hypothetical protein
LKKTIGVPAIVSHGPGTWLIKNGYGPLTSKEERKMTKIVLSIARVMCLLLLISSRISAEQTVFDAKRLYDDYRANPTKLKAQLQGKNVYVIGKVHMKGRTIGIVYFTFETGKEQNVVCILGSMSEVGYKNLLIGSVVTASGTFNGYPDHIRLAPCLVMASEGVSAQLKSDK